MFHANPGAALDPYPPQAPTTPGPRRRRILLAATLGLCLTTVAAAGLLLIDPPASQPAPMVLDRPNSVLHSQTLDRAIEVAADNVTLRRLTIRTGASAAIRIRPGVTGTLVEDTQIHCTSRNTDGIVPGGYTARRVETFGCRNPFQQVGTTTTITQSRQDGQPYRRTPTEAPSTAPAPPPDTTTTPESISPPAAAAPPTPRSYWPGATTTGVPAGTVLRNSGSLTLRTDGQIVSGLNITGCVNVYARNVQILRSRISCSSTTFAIRTFDTTVNLLVQDVEINGNAKTAAAVCCGNYTLRRVNIHNTIDGPRLGNRSTVIDSWIHDLSRVPESHNDTLQTTGGSNILIQHNALEPYKASTQDPMNACLMVGSTTSPSVSNLLMVDNYCDGGNYSIGVRTDLVGSNIAFRRNKFGRHYRYGIIARPRQAGIIWEFNTNVWFDNGLPVVR